MLTVPREEITARWQGLQAALGGAGMAGALLWQGADLYYYTGVFQQGVLWVPAAGQPVFCVRRSYEEAARYAQLDQVVRINSYKQLSEVLQSCGYTLDGVIGLEYDVLPVQYYEMLRQLFPAARWQNVSHLIRQQRAVKSAFELKLIRQAAAALDDAYSALSGELQPGQAEHQIAARLEQLLRQRGHQGVVRLRGLNSEFHYGCVLAGPSGGVASYFDGPLGGCGLSLAYPMGPGREVWQTGQPLMIDYVACLEGYCVDMSRVFVAGQLPPLLEKAHQVALEIEQAIVESVRPGRPAEEAHLLALTMAEKAGLAEHFMGHGSPVGFIGHGVGLELNELPVLARGIKALLVAGMVIAVEPKFIFPGLGAVGTESTYLLTEHKMEKLTRFPAQLYNIAG
ncbi:MAG: M24 family metallopeptidase [Bacillota bacterium]|uniref:M24 family metallopeptidase n=1 Tax=Desulfurispora thermophila TaxID=265470 RepID=UPI00037115F4|nr:Xaa-Pro peptidase family protein [Desulfurispora thermophila]